MAIALGAEQPPHPRPLSPEGERVDRRRRSLQPGRAG
jgi:hypothetical protein